MKCSECVEAGEKSTVRGGMGSVTCMYCPPWYDEEGVYHKHDRNTRTSRYRCSKGHSWVEKKSKSPCPGCDWGHDE
jgi:hypothetical protein